LDILFSGVPLADTSVKDSQHLGNAQQFLHFLFTAEAQAAFEGYGFIRVDNH
jgi:ABC-type molybdate transport system substrate-binding protein